MPLLFSIIYGVVSFLNDGRFQAQVKAFCLVDQGADAYKINSCVGIHPDIIQVNSATRFRFKTAINKFYRQSYLLG